MLNRILLLILFLLLRTCIAYFTRKANLYDDYSLFRGVPINKNHLLFFQNLSEGNYEVNFWTFPGSLHKPVDFLLGPNDRQRVLVSAGHYGIQLTETIKNIQEAFDNQTVSRYVTRRTNTFNWKNYYRTNDIYNWLHDLSTAYPDDMKMRSIGRTHQKRYIYAIEIALGGPKAIRPKVMIEGGIHAREWISVAVVTYLINEIIKTPYSEDPNLESIANMYEWHFVPLLNPDGYEFTHTVNRMWRKNMRSSGGVDLNRNFAYGFGTIGTSLKPGEETYCGPNAFSEPETRALADYVRSHSENLEFYISFHSYGQYIIIPYANSKEHVENFDEVSKLARKAADAIKRRYKTAYSVGTAFDTVGYMTSGVSACWVKKFFRIRYSLVFELRDNGKHGFALPPDLILPTCVETMSGLMTFVNSVNGLGRSCQKQVLVNTIITFFMIFLLAISRLSFLLNINGL